MLPDPIHPAVVHFPIVFSVLLPISVLVALWAIRRGASKRKAWATPAILAVALTASAWVALETGEAEEDRVESVVGEAALHGHEEAAERFLAISGVTVLILAAGMLQGRAGALARGAGAVASLVVLAAGIQVGAAGGELVYRHGAASAYTDGAPARNAPASYGDDDGRD